MIIFKNIYTILIFYKEIDKHVPLQVNFYNGNMKLVDIGVVYESMLIECSILCGDVVITLWNLWSWICSI